MYRRTRKNPTATVKDFTEEGGIVNAAIDDGLAARSITFTDQGDGEGYFSVGGVPVSGTLVPPAATWSGVAGREVVAEDIANRSNSASNLLMDGGFERDVAWWAGVVGTGIELSETQAYQGSQSLKLTGVRGVYPNVTAAGKAGNDSAYGAIKSEGGRVYRASCRIWRNVGNTEAGYFRIVMNGVGESGNDQVGGYGPDNVMNQTDVATGEWVDYTTYLYVPYTGTNAPYEAVIPRLLWVGVDAADVLYVDTVRFEDVTDQPIEVLAPRPTGVRETDTANLQKLLDFVQPMVGTLRLRAGTYAADLVTAKTIAQPRIVGAGEYHTTIDGTIKWQGVPGQFSGGWMSGFRFDGSHAGENAIEFNGACGVHWDEIRVYGTYDVGILFHNELEDEYTEVCSGTASFYANVTAALKYKVTDGISSFHGCGLTEGSNIQHSGLAPAVLITAGARPYNAPLTVRVWSDVDDYPVIKNEGDSQSNFYGHICLEQLELAPLAGGDSSTYIAGTVSAYLGPGLGSAINMGNAKLGTVVTAKSGGPVVYAEHVSAISGAVSNVTAFKSSAGANIVTLTASGTGGNYLDFLNGQTGSGVPPQIKALGGDTNVPIWLVPKGTCVAGLYAFTGNVPTLQAFGADTNLDWVILPKGTGGIRNGSGSTAPGWYKGAGSPEGVVTAPPGSLYSNTSGGADTTLYAKESGTGNTGWSAMAGA